MKNLIILTILTASLASLGANPKWEGYKTNEREWEGYKSNEGDSVWIDEADRPIYEGEEYPIYHEKDGDYRYETILLKDAEAIETYDPERGEYNIYYHDEGGGESYRPRK